MVQHGPALPIAASPLQSPAVFAVPAVPALSLTWSKPSKVGTLLRPSSWPTDGPRHRLKTRTSVKFCPILFHRFCHLFPPRPTCGRLCAVLLHEFDSLSLENFHVIHLLHGFLLCFDMFFALRVCFNQTNMSINPPSSNHRSQKCSSGTFLFTSSKA